VARARREAAHAVAPGQADLRARPARGDRRGAGRPRRRALRGRGRAGRPRAALRARGDRAGPHALRPDHSDGALRVGRPRADLVAGGSIPDPKGPKVDLPNDPLAEPDEDKPAEAPTPPAAAPDNSAELAELKDKHLRLAAEYDNFRRRSLKERQDLHNYAN